MKLTSTVEKQEELLDNPRDWLVIEPSELTSHWEPENIGINYELL